MKYDRKMIMKRAWQIKNTNSEYIFGECLRMAWAETKAPKKVSTKRVINRTIPYSTYKNGAEWCETAGVCIKKGEYNKEDKTIDITINTKAYFLKDSKAMEIEENELKKLVKKFVDTEDEKIIFICEMREKAVKMGVGNANLFSFFYIGTDKEMEQYMKNCSKKDKEQCAVIKKLKEEYFVIG